MRPSRSFMAIIATCALLLLPGSAIVSAQSADQGPMMEDHQMESPAMGSMPDMQTTPVAEASPSMDPDPDPAMMIDSGTMPAGMMPETQSTP